MGLSLVALGVLNLFALIELIKSFAGVELPWGTYEYGPQMYEAIAGYGLGGSSIALFGRVGGGIYTKAADVGADLSGKNEYGMEEDDPRNPACIADNVGDNVGDIAGMGADLFGSFAESTVAALVLAAKGVATDDVKSLAESFTSLYFPVLISMLVVLKLIPSLTKDGKYLPGIENALKLSLIVSTILQTPVVIGLAYFALPESFMLPGAMEATRWGAVTCILVGLWVGLLIG